MANQWIQHVKDYARLNDVNYSEALKDPKCKKEYMMLKEGGNYGYIKKLMFKPEFDSTKIKDPMDRERIQTYIRRKNAENNKQEYDYSNFTKAQIVKSFYDVVKNSNYKKPSIKNITKATKEQSIEFIKKTMENLQLDENLLYEKLVNKEKKPRAKAKPFKEDVDLDNEIKNDEEDYDDDLLHKLQQLIIATDIKLISKALYELNYKGKLQKNKMLLVMQLMQNFNTLEKQKKLYNTLKGITGGNIFTDTFNKAKKDVGKAINRVEKFADSLINGSNYYTRPVRDYLNKIKGKEIVKIKIVRTPVQKAIIEVMNLMTSGRFKRRLEKSDYDQLFHLQLDITCNDGTKFRIEKNETINIESGKSRDKEDSKQIQNIPPNLKVKDLVDNALNKFGTKKYFQYNPMTSNCQDYLIMLLTASGIGTQEDYDFIKQDTDFLFKKEKNLKRISLAATDLGAQIKNTTSALFGMGIDNDNFKEPRKSKKYIEFNL